MVADYAFGLTQKQIATRYNVAQTNVSSVLRGLTWKHVLRPFLAIGRGNYATNGLHQRKRAS
jgi:hypothetical protein